MAPYAENMHSCDYGNDMLNQRKTKAKSKRTVLATVREACLTENHLQFKTTCYLSMTQVINSLQQVAQSAAGAQLSRLVSCRRAAWAAVKQLQNKRQAWPSPAIDPRLHSVESSIQQICYPLIKSKGWVGWVGGWWWWWGWEVGLVRGSLSVSVYLFGKALVQNPHWLI